MAGSLKEEEVARVTVRILENSDLKELTLRKVMVMLADHFNLDVEALGPWKKFVRTEIDKFLGHLPEVPERESEKKVKEERSDKALNPDEVAKTTLRILQKSDLKELTLRKVMNMLADHFHLDVDALTKWKKFVRGEIDNYLEHMPDVPDTGAGKSSGGTKTATTSRAKNARRSSGDSPPKPMKLKGLMKAVVLAQPLADLLGEVVLPRTHISKKISEYVKERNLQNPADKREILCDEKLKKAFDTDKFTYFSLNKLISHLVYKPQDCSKELQELAAKCEEKLLAEMEAQAAEDNINGVTDKKRSRPSRKRKRAPADDDRNRAAKRPNGLTKPMQLDGALTAVCGKSVMSRSEVVKNIWTYIKANNLQDPNDRRKINCDQRLKAVFDGEQQITGFGLSKYLSSHLSTYTGKVDADGKPVSPD